MYLKFIREPIVAGIDAVEVPVETLVECKMYDLFHRGNDSVHFWVEYFDGKRATYEVPKKKGYEAYVMNNNGKTLEHYGWSEDKPS